MGGGCGDSHDSQASPDAASASADADALPLRDVTLQVLDPTLYLRYRNADGAWLHPERVSPESTTYRMRVTSTYEVVARWLTVDDESEVALYHFTSDDVPIIYSALRPTTSETPSTAIAGRMLQAGAVYVRGDSATSSSAPWDFALDASSGTGTAALVAVGADRMLVRRGIDITSPAAIADIDLDADGTTTTVAPLTIANGPEADETLTASLSWSGIGVSLPVSPATFQPPPASLVQPSEVLQLHVEARTATTLRYSAGWFTDERTTFALPPALEGVSFGATGDTVTATWNKLLPTMDGVGMRLIADRGNRHIVTVEASPSWLAATGATSLAFDVSPPDFDPSWGVDPSQPHTRQLAAYRNGVLPDKVDYLLSMVTESAGSEVRPEVAEWTRDPLFGP